ncbi:hypothetical protein Q7P36_000378 [Cladosporium allicinum]
MQLPSRKGKATSTGTLEDYVEHPDKVSLPEKEILLGQVPGPSTSTAADNDLPPNITTDNSAGGSDFDTTQALESWQTQLQHLYTLLDNFQFEFNFNLAKLRAGIPFLSQLSNETDSTAVALVVNSHHIPAGRNDDSCDEDNEDDDAVVQPLPSNSLMDFLLLFFFFFAFCFFGFGFFGFTAGEDLFEPTLDDDDHDRAALSDDEARMDSLAVPGASAAQDGAVRPHRHNHYHRRHHHHHHHHRQQNSEGEVIIDWQRFHAENCRESS